MRIETGLDQGQHIRVFAHHIAHIGIVGMQCNTHLQARILARQRLAEQEQEDDGQCHRVFLTPAVYAAMWG